MSDGVRVLAEQCKTCIFRPGNVMHLRRGRLKDLVDECHRKDGFVVCHEMNEGRYGRQVAGPRATGAVCRGFFDLYDTTPLQLARRLRLVIPVEPPEDSPFEREEEEEMPTIRLGDLFSPPHREWPEGARYAYRGGRHELALFIARPTRDESEAVGRGKARFGLFAMDDLVVLLYHFGNGIPWGDAPYSYHLVPRAQQQLPPLEVGGHRALLTVYLVNAANGRIARMRELTFPPSFTLRLFHSIHRQAVSPFDEGLYDARLNDLRNRYTPEALARHPLTVTCEGGS